jgi:hypothetical protein
MDQDPDPGDFCENIIPAVLPCQKPVATLKMSMSKYTLKNVNILHTCAYRGDRSPLASPIKNQ